jgi:DNA-binding HxlR family transcriptional regulator
MTTKQIPAWCAGEDWCSMTAASNLLGKKWHPVILSILLDRPSGFNRLKDEVEGISSKVLSESLENLQEHGLVEREVVNEQPFRVKYSLTETGRELEPVLDELRRWAEKHLKPADKEETVA